MENGTSYKSWTHDSLVERVMQLEKALKAKTTSFSRSQSPQRSASKNTRQARQFDPSKYNTRLIALKLAYLGKRYNGFEHHVNNKTPLPTIEEELWKALNKARLIFPKDTDALSPGEVNWEGCEYSKCGRTDKGVSAFGQVIGIRVRSNRPLLGGAVVAAGADGNVKSEDLGNTFPRANGIENAAPPLRSNSDGKDNTSGIESNDESDFDIVPFDNVADEIPYAQLLNRLLPPDIRILAWCPAPPLDFSARFSCRERQYKYFFTQPAFQPTPASLEIQTSTINGGNTPDGWLNIAAMREAAQNFIGVHDFRNFCKVDPSKQISNFEREIFYADIVEVEDTTSCMSHVDREAFRPQTFPSNNPKVYTFTLHGSAFLWHQVRHMVAVLFLVGQGLESPSIVSQLLDVEKNPCRPLYEMASDTPLVLWNCVFPHEDDEQRKDVMQWHYVGDGRNCGDAKYGSPGLMDDLWQVWRERKIDEVLAGSLISVVAEQGVGIQDLSVPSRKGIKSQKVFDGGNKALMRGAYMPVMKKPRLDSVEIVNQRYAVRKGFTDSEEMKELGFRRLNKPLDTSKDNAQD